MSKKIKKRSIKWVPPSHKRKTKQPDTELGCEQSQSPVGQEEGFFAKMKRWNIRQILGGLVVASYIISMILYYFFDALSEYALVIICTIIPPILMLIYSSFRNTLITLFFALWILFCWWASKGKDMRTMIYLLEILPAFCIALHKGK